MAAGHTPRKMSTYVFLHFNTTCLPEDEECRITEMCLLAVNKKDLHVQGPTDQRSIPPMPRVTNKLVICLNPVSQIHETATEISQLTNESLAGQNCFTSDTARSVKGFLSHLKKRRCFISHYGDGFDFPVLKAELERVGLPELFDKRYCADSLNALKSLWLYEHNTTEGKSFKLRTYYSEKFGSPPEESHTAEGYCKALIAVAQATPRFFEWIDRNAKRLEHIESKLHQE